MQLVSFFSGIGGFELAASWMGWKIVATSEINPFCQRVLKYYWPKAYHHDDVRTFDFKILNSILNRNEKTIFTAGFPCQPFSTAGKRKGTDDERYGWPDCLRAVREIQPSWCVFENVRGLTNWNGGMVFDQVQADMETEGYEVIPFLLPAAGVNAPHRRDRIWFVANAISSGYTGWQTSAQGQQHDGGRDARCESESFGCAWPAANAIGKRLPLITCREQREVSSQAKLQQRSKPGGAFSAFTEWQNFPTQSPVCSGNDGFSGNLVDITVSKWRNESLKSLGNAIVPQVAHEIFKAIDQFENL